MRRRVAMLALAGAAPLLNGCVIVAIPAVAATTLVGSRVKASRDAQKKVAAAIAVAAIRPKPAEPVQPVVDVPVSPAKPAPGEALVVPSPSTAPGVTLAAPGTVPQALRYVPGSADSAALSARAYRSFADYLVKVGADYRAKRPLRQVVLADGATLAAPYFEPCGAKPPAVVIDIDESALPDLGFDSAAPVAGSDESRWQRWEVGGAAAVAAVPGAAEALAAIRAAGVDVIFDTNRANARADDTAAALNAAGVGPAEHFKTLWLKGDDGGGAGKDNRRWAIASGYCVVALVGDQLGDFSDAFYDGLTPAKRRAAAGARGLAALWSNGWFVLPNLVNGPIARRTGEGSKP